VSKSRYQPTRNSNRNAVPAIILLPERHSGLLSPLFMTHNKNNKAQCKKYFLIAKMTILICVNRKLRGMKTKKQENNRTLKSTVVSYVQTLAPGSATMPRSLGWSIVNPEGNKQITRKMRNAIKTESIAHICNYKTKINFQNTSGSNCWNSNNMQSTTYLQLKQKTA